MRKIGYFLVPCGTRRRLVEGVTHIIYIIEEKEKDKLTILPTPNKLLNNLYFEDNCFFR